ncbi:MAG: NAD-dependent epimerase/dehydratase family protein [Peptococcaceae bacterium]|nr:MAG: NAD-dependent epimerase/dehydratase family protein [Peptococcaceae bacterium]
MVLMKGKKVLVTGGAGFLGSHLCEGLLAAEADVRVLDTFSSGRAGNLSGYPGSLEIFTGDISDEGDVGRAAQGVDVIIHAAFPMPVRERSMETKHIGAALAGLFNLLKEAVAREALFVYFSSIAVYGDQRYIPVDEEHPCEPVTLYGAVKLAGEHFCRALAKSPGLRYVILRIADIYGPRNSRVSTPVKFLLQAMRKENIVVHGSGRQSRTYTYAGDLVDAVLKVIINPAAHGRIFNIAGDEAVSIYELALAVREVTGGKVDIILAPGEPADDRKLVIDGSKAKRILGFQPRIKLAEGLSLTYRWLGNNPLYYG